MKQITRLFKLLSIGLCMTAVAVAVVSISPHPEVAYAANPGADNAAKDKGGDTQTGLDTSAKNKDPITGETVKKTSVLQYVNSAYAYLAGIGGLLAVLMIVWAGYRYMTSYGDPEKISDAKDIIEKSLIGLSLLILAAVILNTLNPRTTDPCTPGQKNCGDIDFSKADGGSPKK